MKRTRVRAGNRKAACGSKVALRGPVVYVAAEAATHKERGSRDLQSIKMERQALAMVYDGAFFGSRRPN
jgi:hypothetical protein